MRQLLTLLPFLGLFCSLLANAGQDVRVAVISDINGRYASSEYHRRVSAAIKQIIRLEPDMVISTGDMVAGQRSSPPLTREELQTMWRSFAQTVHQPLIDAGIPLVMTPGNHDASAYPGFELERTQYADYHLAHPHLISPAPGGNYPFHFSVTLGTVKLLSLDATRKGPLDAAQREWLAKELAHNSSRHTLVFGHLPLQAVAHGRERGVIDDPELEALLENSRITAYLSGHHHAYYPGYRRGVDMLSIGNLGGNQRKLTDTDQNTGFSFVLLELASNGGMKVAAFLSPDFEETIDIHELPTSIGKGPGKLQRRDLVNRDSPRDITAGEKP